MIDVWKPLADGDRVRAVPTAMIDLARTAGHFHRLDVIHRDLKPANVLCRPLPGGDKLAIADFGISKVVPAGLDAPTPAYSAQQTSRAYTEMYGSQQRRFLPADKRDDVFALAVIWHQLLRGDVQLPRPGGEGWKKVLARLGLNADAIALLAASWDDEAYERPADGLKFLAEPERRAPDKATVPASPPPPSPPVALAPPPAERIAPNLLDCIALKDRSQGANRQSREGGPEGLGCLPR